MKIMNQPGHRTHDHPSFNFFNKTCAPLKFILERDDLMVASSSLTFADTSACPTSSKLETEQHRQWSEWPWFMQSGNDQRQKMISYQVRMKQPRLHAAQDFKAPSGKSSRSMQLNNTGNWKTYSRIHKTCHSREKFRDRKIFKGRATFLSCFDPLHVIHNELFQG